MIICIAHRKDLDGIACHAIVHRYAERRCREIEHVFVNYDDFEAAIAELSASDCEIVIADMGYNAGFAKLKHRLLQLAKSNRISWLDHHDWSDAKDFLKLPIRFVLSSELCAAELVQREYASEDEVSRKIAALAREHDFRKSSELAAKLYEIISSGFEKPKLVQTLAQGIFWDEELEKAYEDYQIRKKNALKLLEERSKLYRIGDWTCLLSFSDDSLSSSLACDALLKKGSDFVACVWQDGKLSFRRNSSVPLVKIAKLFSGGGRDEASGGKLEKEVKEKDYEKALEEIVQKIALAYEVLKS